MTSKEIQKTKFAADIRLVSLASRSNMCINDSVLSLKNNALINERCLELQKKKSKLIKGENDAPPAKKQKKAREKSSCPHYKSSLISQLRDQSLLKVQDIEQLVNEGRQIGKDFHGISASNAGVHIFHFAPPKAGEKFSNLGTLGKSFWWHEPPP